MSGEDDWARVRIGGFGRLAAPAEDCDPPTVFLRRTPAEMPLDHEDVLAIMRALADLRADTGAIRELLEEDDGPEEEDGS